MDPTVQSYLGSFQMLSGTFDGKYINPKLIMWNDIIKTRFSSKTEFEYNNRVPYDEYCEEGVIICGLTGEVIGIGY